MANFTTHIGIGTLVSGALAVVTLAADVVAPENLVAVTLAGVVGSVLPDIDLKDSRPSQALFAGLAVFFSFIVLFMCAGHYSIAEMLVLWLGTLVGVRYGARYVFHRMSYHRGIWHSFLATALCSLATAVFFYYALGRPDAVAWLGAGFMAIGYLTHLTLDEIYSVDVMNTRVKASFGTALKLADFKHWGHTAAMAATVAAIAFIAPPIGTFRTNISSHQMWSGLQRNLLPANHSRWFGVDWAALAHNRALFAKGTPRAEGDVAAPVAGGTPNPITTGAIGPDVKKPE